MEESQFKTLAGQTLENYADQIDDILGDKVDVELESGILTLTLPGGGQYVINIHAPLKQIWMSSPVSGASHFDCVDGIWTKTRPPHGRLPEMLAEELGGTFGVTLDL